MSDLDVFLAVGAIMLSVTFIGLPLVIQLRHVTPATVGRVIALSFMEMIFFVVVLEVFLSTQGRWSLMVLTAVLSLFPMIAIFVILPRYALRDTVIQIITSHDDLAVYEDDDDDEDDDD